MYDRDRGDDRYGPPGGGAVSDAMLPTAPRERTAEELEMEALGLGGAFRDQARYGDRLDGGDRDGFGEDVSRADGDWTKKAPADDVRGRACVRVQTRACVCVCVCV